MQANSMHSHNIQHMTQCHDITQFPMLIVQHTAVGNPTFKQVQMYY